jgi:hypothetical protein
MNESLNVRLFACMYAVTCVRTHKGPVLRTRFIGPIKKGSNTNIILCSYICVCVYICMCVCMYVCMVTM